MLARDRVYVVVLRVVNFSYLKLIPHKKRLSLSFSYLLCTSEMLSTLSIEQN